MVIQLGGISEETLSGTGEWARGKYEIGGVKSIEKTRERKKTLEGNWHHEGKMANNAPPK